MSTRPRLSLTTHLRKRQHSALQVCQIGERYPVASTWRPCDFGEHTENDDHRKSVKGLGRRSQFIKLSHSTMTVKTSDLQGVSKLVVRIAPLLFITSLFLFITTYSAETVQERTLSSEEQKHLEHIQRDLTQNANSHQKLNRQDVSRNRTSLLLVTSGRSGSTFTSAIISHHEDVFYTSEPLHHIGNDIYNEVVSPGTTQKAKDVVEAFLTCDFRKMDTQLFRSELFLNSKSTENIYNCLRNRVSAQECRLAKYTLFYWVLFCFSHSCTYFFSCFYSCCIVASFFFLLRDFRATLYSQAAAFKTFNMTTEGGSRAKALCASLESNARELESLLRLFPERIRVIRYEDGCLNPVSYARSIYTFAGLQFSQDTETYIKSITKSKKSQKIVSDQFKVERSDALETMNKWRSFADFGLVQKIDRVCMKADAIFGYKTVKTSVQLLSNTYSLVTKPKLPKGIYQFV
ncbi:hypothetical protein EGW08_005005, partial [Elysia chlorotica]